MTSSKYGNLLTVVLIVLIIVILTVIGFLVYNYIIKPEIDRQNNIEALERFDEAVEEQKENANTEEKDMERSTESTGDGAERVRQRPTTKEGFIMLGKIKIPKTNVNLPILEEISNEALNTGAVLVYPTNPQINEPGNIVIIGHNLQNGRLFSNNKKLENGDKIQITDNTGREMIYTVYDKFEADDTDASFYNRDTDVPEVTLSCCVDQRGSNKRLIVVAKAE